MEKVWLKNYPKNVNPEIDLSQYTNIMSVFDEACRKYKYKTAFSNMDVGLTFEELDVLSGRFCAFLQNELGLKKGDRIAIQMPNVLQFPIAMFGAFRAGLIVVNTNPLYTAREMAHQFKDSECSTLVILANFAYHLKEVLPQTKIKNIIVTELGDLFPQPKKFIVNAVVKYVKKMVPAYSIPSGYNVFSYNKVLSKGADKPYSEVEMIPEDIAYLQYTGGTTGVSKGAMLTHRNIIANMLQIAEWMKPQLTEGQEVALTPLPLYHIFSLTVNSLAFLRYGAENVLITNPKDIPGFIKLMKKQRFTIMSGVNTLFNALANNPEIESVDFSNVKVSVAGGMALQKAVHEKWTSKTKTQIVEGYGLTEASPVIACNPIDGTDKVGTIGLPLPSTEIKIISEDGAELGFGEVGELCARGPQVMLGYWNRPEETKNVLDSRGWLKTGDMAQIEESGFIKIVDRKKDMILVSGFNVYPNEIEDIIATHPKVLEVAAIGTPDDHSGEVVKVFVVKKDESLTEAEVIEFAKKNLTNYKVPRHVEFRKELPKTNVGKILRRELRTN